MAIMGKVRLHQYLSAVKTAVDYRIDVILIHRVRKELRQANEEAHEIMKQFEGERYSELNGILSAAVRGLDEWSAAMARDAWRTYFAGYSQESFKRRWKRFYDWSERGFVEDCIKSIKQKDLWPWKGQN